MTRPAAVLLASATRYALSSLSSVTPAALTRRTPCAAWDLAALLHHVSDSLIAVHDGITAQYVSLSPAASTASPPEHLIAAVRGQASQLLTASIAAGHLEQPVAIADRWLAGTMVAAVGAVEIAVHGWDIAQACRQPQPIPPTLAADLLAVLPLAVTGPHHGSRFAAPVIPSPGASPGDRLVALLGRNPHPGVDDPATAARPVLTSPRSRRPR